MNPLEIMILLIIVMIVIFIFRVITNIGDIIKELKSEYRKDKNAVFFDKKEILEIITQAIRHFPWLK